MLSVTRVWLTRKAGQTAAKSSAAASQISNKKNSRGQQKSSASSTTEVPPPIDVDASRFTSTPYKSGKTKTSTLFKKSFLEDIVGKKGSENFFAIDDNQNAAKKSQSSSSSSSPSSQRRRPRPNPFATFSNEEERAAFERLVKKNMRTLQKNTNEETAQAMAKQISAASEEHKAVTGTELSVMKVPQLASLKYKKRGEISKLLASPLHEENAKGAALFAKIIMRRGETAAIRNRASSPFYSKRAVEHRGGSISAPSTRIVRVSSKGSQQKKNKAEKSAKKSKDSHTNAKEEKAVDFVKVANAKPKLKAVDKDDTLNPVNITANFFTSYEKKQYSRLKNATLYLRNPKKFRLNKARRALYSWWDRVVEGVKA